jgi:hypothetical protein
VKQVNTLLPLPIFALQALTGELVWEERVRQKSLGHIPGEGRVNWQMRWHVNTESLGKPCAGWRWRHHLRLWGYCRPFIPRNSSKAPNTFQKVWHFLGEGYSGELFS